MLLCFLEGCIISVWVHTVPLAGSFGLSTVSPVTAVVGTPFCLGPREGYFCLVFPVSLLIWRQSSRFVGDLGKQLAFVGAIPLLPATVDRPWACWYQISVNLWILDL